MDERKRKRDQQPRSGWLAGGMLALILVWIGVGSAAAAAHDEAVLKSRLSSVTAGDRLPLEGSHFGENESFTLLLIGALREFELRKATADDDGIFSLELAIPVEVRPGAYQVVAIAADGDVAARLDLTVLEPAASTAGEDKPGAVDGGGPQGGDRSARVEEIRIQRDRSGLEWGIIGLVTGLAGGLGMGMLRRGRSAA